ncbi:hypothetical protein [Methanococcus maripaludis]|uniref:Uncharacterized protein n=1 Tax=Methanococcus maripaludis TaxID=39152 RepID=A0A7J9PME3_METMI|nr:hypothetical protein [Methanococcus maripaludis]MBA2864443.1 hypothetical protein [Methanococcus maripaludis]
MIPKEIIHAALNFKTYDWPFKFVFLMVVFGQTTGIMFPELAHTVLWINCMTITILVVGMGCGILWGGVCTILSGTTIGSWKIKNTTKLPGWFRCEDIIAIPASILGILWAINIIWTHIGNYLLSPFENALWVFTSLFIFIISGSYLLSIPRRLPGC